MNSYCKTVNDSRYWSNTSAKELELAPSVYRNWLAYTDQSHCYGTDEYTVLTDGHITGELCRRDQYHATGPYEMINLAHSDTDNSTQIRLVLRVSRFLHPSPLHRNSDELHPFELCDAEAPADDFIALLSLCIGIPLRSGGVMRRFNSGEQPKGRPTAFDIHGLPERPRGQYTSRMILSSVGEANLGIASPFLSVFPNLTPSQAAAIVRAARLYRDALWYSDSMPDMSWLMLSNAAETIARESLPELKPSKRFTRHLCFHTVYSPPSCRPPSGFQVEWNHCQIARCSKGIYHLRSDMVHEGRPLPSELRRPPEVIHGVQAEYPPPYDGNPKVVHLHIFAHLVQNSILLWLRTQGDKPQESKTGDCEE